MRSCVPTRLNLPSSVICQNPLNRLSRTLGLVAFLAPVLAFHPSADAQVTNVGSASLGSSAASSVTVTLNQADTLSSIAVLTQGAAGSEFSNAGTGTCTVAQSYNAGDSCTVQVSFTPQFAGNAYGSVVLTDAAGNIIGNAYLSATGVGPQAKFMPGTESAVGSSVATPETAVADGNGNLYIADSGNNRILKETLAGGVYSETVVSTSTLNWPGAVAVDGAGNLFIADTFNNRILEEIPNAGGYTETTIATSSLQYPFGLTVDKDGSVYIADTFNNRILKETLSSGSYSETTIPTSSLNLPIAVAVDDSENVYVVDNANNRVLKETLSEGNYTETTVPSSPLMYPSGVAVDVAGSIYIADTNNSRILVETPAGASYTETVLPTGSPLSYPSGVALDGSGNVYIADQCNNRVLREDFADVPAVSFAATTLNTVNPTPQVIQVENAGNASLNFSAVSFPSDFPELGQANADCTSTTSLASGATCSLSITFAPTAALNGNPSLQLTEGVSITTNTLNVAGTQQSIAVSGTELQP